MINDFFKKFLTNNAVFYNNTPIFFDNPYEELKYIEETQVFSLLFNKGLLKIHGRDAESFLNTQFTNNAILENNEVRISSYCNPKGRIISVFYLFKVDEDIYIYTLKDNIKKLIETLDVYKMMSDVSFTIIECDIVGFPEKNLKKEKKSYKQNKNIYLSLSNQLICFTENASSVISATNKCIGFGTFNLLDIEAKIPFLSESFIEKYTPQMISLDKLGGVSFNKGCYPGQEVIARTHYLGESKQSLYLINVKSEKIDVTGNNMLSIEDKITQSAIINIAKASSSEFMALAVIRNDDSSKQLCINKDAIVSNILKI
tara:strand:+ start:1436 stop:2380 length:945 start_codon:yes stop_codon:yes gene_type:complete